MRLLTPVSRSPNITPENIKNKIKRMIWRSRINLFTLCAKLNPHIMSGFVIWDAPSGFGKTYYVRKLAKTWDTSKIRILSGEEFMGHFLRALESYDYRIRAIPIHEVLGDHEVIIVEDIDIVLTGKDVTQEYVAHMFMKAIDRGTKVLVTGINIADKAPVFYWEMTYMCDHKYYTAHKYSVENHTNK